MTEPTDALQKEIEARLNERWHDAVQEYANGRGTVGAMMKAGSDLADQLTVSAERDARLRAALEPFAAIGQWLFARPEMADDTTLVDVHHINGIMSGLTRGQFKAAHAALQPPMAE